MDGGRRRLRFIRRRKEEIMEYRTEAGGDKKV